MSGAKLPERWRRRQPLEARKLNQVVEAITRQEQGAPAIQQRVASEVTLPEIRQFKVTEVLQDYLVCLPWDGVAEGTALTYVAKPPTLRASVTARNGITYTGVSTNGQTRTATSGSDSETQVIIPTYLLGDVLYAVRNVKGGTGVTREAGGADVPVVWQDLNVDGRQWAEDE